ncbi:probable serine/threonine-protein kinase clkA isoform X2 [Apis dorsata]|uniref:probable serine/threonine-protein kinase clkA isoform X2 n=1 Tax=Apis dorsata TaxID=7462 RepID=UPI001292DF21|nr:probable serine/threonine-protein kinase clkA isoform X2 [Apis dorsata]
MENFVFFIFYCIVLLFLREGISLRCHSGNQEMDVQFQKVLKTCRNRHIDLNTVNSNDSISTENSDIRDFVFEENVYDKNIFHKNNNNHSYNEFKNNQKYRNSDKNSGTNIYSSNQLIKGNKRYLQNIKRIHEMNNRDFWNSKNLRNRKSDFNNKDMNNEDMYFNNDTNQEQDCIIQCFFNELNVVDQKGFPERNLVISLISQNIQNPELKDFIEESIIECFHYLESNKREKCEFSQNLLKCLSEKGQQVFK